MWQCAIHRPGFVTSRRMSAVSPVRTSLPDQALLGLSVVRQHDEAPDTVDVERMVRRVVGVHLVGRAAA
jgi:hypothetical protein